MLSQQQLAFYNENGYLLVKGSSHGSGINVSNEARTTVLVQSESLRFTNFP